MGVLGIDAHGIDHLVDADPAGHADDGFNRVFLVKIYDFRALTAGHGKAVLVAITRPAPMSLAEAMANCPTGPQPNTATVSPSLMSAISAPNQPVGKMSESKMA